MFILVNISTFFFFLLFLPFSGAPSGKACQKQLHDGTNHFQNRVDIQQINTNFIGFDKNNLISWKIPEQRLGGALFTLF